MTGLLLPAAPRSEAPTGPRLNRLRAGVLGANDGIVSVAAIAVGVAGATDRAHTILLVGLAALVGGAISMALGEYVSVSSQRDAQRAHRGRTADPELHAPDRHEHDEAGPWSAAAASFLAFGAGGLLPVLAMLLLPTDARVPGTVAVVVLALAATGAAGARLGGASVPRATLRVVVGGMLALAVTFTIGHLLGTGVVG